jgi:hypothetical protein
MLGKRAWRLERNPSIRFLFELQKVYTPFALPKCMCRTN